MVVMRTLPETEMTKYGNNVVAMLAISVFVIMLPACQKPEGPLEKVGKSIDKAVEKTGDNVKRAGEDIKDAVKKN